jgi:hypothetical protein
MIDSNDKSNARISRRSLLKTGPALSGDGLWMVFSPLKRVSSL